ncbi:MAG: glycosyltransferase family 1 protein [Vicinamibacterales bacterium]
MTGPSVGRVSAGRVRVGFDGRALTSPAAGIRRYSRELFSALNSLGAPIELVMLGGTRSVVPDHVEWVREPAHPPTNAGWMIVGLPLAARRARVEVLHAPAYTAPFWSPAPIVLTIHDVSYARHPEWFPYRRDWLRRAFYRQSAMSASLVITDSQFSAGEIQAAYGISQSQIEVIPLGVVAAFTQTGNARIVLPTTVKVPFVLHVGDLHERRNLPMLMRAVLAARQRSAGCAGLSLVLAGVDRGVSAALHELASADGMPDAVVTLGKVDDATLRGLYGRALALVYPSLYEGFGLPVLEAMAAGLPVVAAQAASIPEVLGDAGVLLDPHDESQWTEALTKLAADKSWAAALSAAGRARAAAFTWERTARQTLAVYNRALGGRIQWGLASP